jgi:hypothetical protein
MAVIGLLTVLAWYSHANGAATLPLPAVAAPPVQPSSAPPPEAESVRVEHQLVQASLFVPLARPRFAHAAVTRRADVRRDPHRFVARASRALMGDGRYRPEPFPRPAMR